MLDKTSIIARFLFKRKDFVLDVDFEIQSHGITVVHGVSGSGKTTLLRCIAGLERPEAGFLKVNGVVWQDGSQFLPTYKRSVGYVFQEDSLFPHLTAKGNILFGLSDRKQIPEDLSRIIAVLGIDHLLERKPCELSGGERQRVAIARAFAIRPDLLLLDEPLSSLDEDRKAEILPCIKRLCEMRGTPIVYITHDVSETVLLGAKRVNLSELLKHG